MHKAVKAESKGVSPVYARIAGVFRRRIEDGVWPVGSQIPTLEALMAETGASRVTVRQALTQLENRGLLARYRGRGTFVLQGVERDVWCEVETDWASLVAAHEGVATDLLKCEPAARPPRASHPGGELAASYQFIQRRHRRGGIPYLVGYAHLDAALWRRLSVEEIEDQPLIRAIEAVPGFAVGRAAQTLVVSSADFEVARLLDIAPDAPLVVVDRSVFDTSGVLALETRGYYRAEFIKLSMRLK